MIVHPFVAIDVPAELADVAAAQLFELGALGIERRDSTTLARGANDDLVTLVGAFADHETARAALEAFDAELAPRLEEIVGDAWRDEWKKHFEPFRLSTHLVVRPPWKEAARALIEEVEGTRVLELEPGRAFGTGLHESTALVAQVLDHRRATLVGVEVLDVGCGSGVLALAAIALGAKSARAIDVDPDAVSVTLENAERAGWSERVVADTRDVGAIDRTFPVVLANIQAEVLVPRATDLAARVAPGGLLVLSGILVEQKDAVRAAYENLTLVDAPTLGEWVALVLQRNA